MHFLYAYGIIKNRKNKRRIKLKKENKLNCIPRIFTFALLMPRVEFTKKWYEFRGNPYKISLYFNAEESHVNIWAKHLGLYTNEYE